MGSYPITRRTEGPRPSLLSVFREVLVGRRCFSSGPAVSCRGHLPCATARAAARPRAGVRPAATAAGRPHAAPHRPHLRGAVASAVPRTRRRTGPWRCPVRVRIRGSPAESACSRDRPQTRQEVPHRLTPRLVGQVVAPHEGLRRIDRGQRLTPGAVGSWARSGDRSRDRRERSRCARDRAGIDGVAAHPGGAAPAGLGPYFPGEDARRCMEPPRRAEATKEDGHQGRYDVHLSACFHQVDWARGVRRTTGPPHVNYR